VHDFVREQLLSVTDAHMLKQWMPLHRERLVSKSSFFAEDQNLPSRLVIWPECN